MASEFSGKLSNKRRQMMRGLHVRHDGEQLIKGERQVAVTGKVEETKQVRRQIANKNERRRMESINAGFQALRDLLPQRIDGERVSKAAILQHAVDHVMRLTKEHACLLLENDSLRRSLHDQSTLRQILQDSMASPSAASLPPPLPVSRSKRQKCDIESTCEDSVSLYSDDVYHEELCRHLADVKVQLEQERRRRLAAEEKLASPASVLSPPPAHCSESLLSPLHGPGALHLSEALSSPVRTHWSVGDQSPASAAVHEQHKQASQCPALQPTAARLPAEQQTLAVTTAPLQPSPCPLPSSSPAPPSLVSEKVGQRRASDVSSAGSVGLDTIVAAIQYVEGLPLVTEEELAEEGQSSAHVCVGDHLLPSPPSPSSSPLCLVSSAKREAALQAAVYAGQFVALSEALRASRDGLTYNRPYPAPVAFRTDTIYGM